jgi:hypothetical protein
MHKNIGQNTTVLVTSNADDEENEDSRYSGVIFGIILSSEPQTCASWVLLVIIATNTAFDYEMRIFVFIYNISSLFSHHKPTSSSQREFIKSFSLCINKELGACHSCLCWAHLHEENPEIRDFVILPTLVYCCWESICQGQEPSRMEFFSLLEWLKRPTFQQQHPRGMKIHSHFPAFSSTKRNNSCKDHPHDTDILWSTVTRLPRAPMQKSGGESKQHHKDCIKRDWRETPGTKNHTRRDDFEKEIPLLIKRRESDSSRALCKTGVLFINYRTVLSGDEKRKKNTNISSPFQVDKNIWEVETLKLDARRHTMQSLSLEKQRLKQEWTISEHSVYSARKFILAACSCMHNSQRKDYGVEGIFSFSMVDQKVKSSLLYFSITHFTSETVKLKKHICNTAQLLRQLQTFQTKKLNRWASKSLFPFFYWQTNWKQGSE